MRDASISASHMDAAELGGREGIVEGSGLAGADGPELDALFVFRHNFLMLFIDTKFELLFTFSDCGSSPTESTENRLDGAFDIRSTFGPGRGPFAKEELRSGGMPIADGNLPNGSGESGITGDSFVCTCCLRDNEGGSFGASE